MAPTAEDGGASAGRTRFDVADIFRQHRDEALQKHSFSNAQHQVMNHIMTCRTQALGGHLDVCDNCGVIKPSYNSCRDRHCPKCQTVRQLQWVALRAERMLPIPHFHVVFTVPGKLRPLFKAKPRELYNIIINAASQTLLDFGKNPRWIGGLIGCTAILHTWTRDLQFHPHVHCLVTAGGFSDDRKRWLKPRRGLEFLFPTSALSLVFRAKFIQQLRAIALTNPTAFPSRHAFDALMDRMSTTHWNVHTEPPMMGSNHVITYLGRYTHRVAISNSRIIAFENGIVEFMTKDGRTARIPATEFIRRFLDHVLPRRFVKIRHFGLYGATHALEHLEQARALLPARPASAPALVLRDHDGQLRPLDTAHIIKVLTGIESGRCTECGCGQMHLLEPIPTNRGPP